MYSVEGVRKGREGEKSSDFITNAYVLLFVLVVLSDLLDLFKVLDQKEKRERGYSSMIAFSIRLQLFLPAMLESAGGRKYVLLLYIRRTTDSTPCQKRKRDAEHQALVQKRVQHSKIMQHPLGGFVALSRELGSCSRTLPRDIPGKAFACGLRKRTDLRVLDESGFGEVSKFARDELTGGYVVGMVRPFVGGENGELMRKGL
ncbi:MAG: hypothetical protein M1830_003879 [Pleopsidium flavum]|nr:MAG: hypothetical protein M1830_003879 [Pleopsidium flavum]